MRIPLYAFMTWILDLLMYLKMIWKNKK